MLGEQAITIGVDRRDLVFFYEVDLKIYFLIEDRSSELARRLIK